MNGFINNKVLPPIMKFVNTRAMTALKNGMLFAMPFIIVGSIFLILAKEKKFSDTVLIHRAIIRKYCAEIRNYYIIMWQLIILKLP